MIYKNGNYVYTIDGKPCKELGPFMREVCIQSDSTAKNISATAFINGSMYTSWTAGTAAVSAGIPMTRSDSVTLSISQARDEGYLAGIETTGLGETPTAKTVDNSSVTWTGIEVPYGRDSAGISGYAAYEERTASASGFTLTYYDDRIIGQQRITGFSGYGSPSTFYGPLVMPQGVVDDSLCWQLIPDASAETYNFGNRKFSLQPSAFKSLSITAEIGVKMHLYDISTSSPTGTSMKVSAVQGYYYGGYTGTGAGGGGASTTVYHDSYEYVSNVFAASCSQDAAQGFYVQFRPNSHQSAYYNYPGYWGFSGVLK